MSTNLTKSDVGRFLRPLKPFQRDAVDHIFSQLFTGESVNSQARFLLADEVGLGKTLVARGVIAKAVEWYQSQDSRDNRVDIVYICSNRNIASQNVNRLNITKNDSLALPTRLTMLPLRLPEIRENDVNFISLTPGTSFNLAYRGGRYEERVLLYHVLQRVWNLGPSKRYVNLLRCRKGHENWRSEVKKFGKEIRTGEKEINKEIVEKFGEALSQEAEDSKRGDSQSLREEFEEAAELYTHKRTTKRPDRHREAQKRVVGRLRRCLADVSVDYLTADLVVLDEFQRFKSLLDGDDTDAQLARRLFESAKAKGRKTRLLLLSATPYKMYTTYSDSAEDDHYEDFFRTLDFLFADDEENKEKYESLLRKYRYELLGSTTDEKRIADYKSKIESILRQVMLRTERFKEIQDREGLVDEVVGEGRLTAEEVRQYASAQKLREDYEVHNLLRYWKSAPYLPSFMGESYKLKSQIVSSLDPDDTSTLPRDTPSEASLQELEKLSIDYRRIRDYEEIGTRNSRLRELVQTAITGPQSWQILWTPASLPYWKHRGPYIRPAERDFTKSLVFSGWKMVPNAVSVLGTYEAERRMMSASKYTYEEIGERASRLTFQLESGKPTEMASMALFYPCLALARCVDPARLASRHSNKDSIPTYQTIRSEAASKIKSLLDQVGIEVSSSGGSDIRHYWKYMAYLDAKENSEHSSVQGWLNTDQESIRWQSMVGRDGEAEGFSAHVERLKEAFDSAPPAITPRAVERLADVAINAPATTALRALLRSSGRIRRESLPTLLGSAARIAMGFRRRFNQPWIIESLTANDSSPYWEIVLDHCRDGNLQSVLDEFYHVIRESEGLIDHSPGEVSEGLADYTQSVLSIRPASLNVETFSTERTPHLDTHKMRTHFALRLGDDKEILDTEDPLRGDIVRRAFNSPFHPFILATTSIGQEGLDFHQFCHSIFHWNLPSNPIDLEQREGRINRYKGHVIRRNVAESFGLPEVSKTDSAELDDPWERLFNLAEREVEGSTRGLQPNWIYETEDAFKIHRHVPSIPFSRDVERLDNLKEDIMYYRLAFGQPRQQDLIDHLQRKHASLSAEEVEQKVREQYIDLAPRSREG